MLLLSAVTIRQATEADVDAIFPLVQAFMRVAPLFLAPDDSSVRAMLTTFCRLPSSCVLIAEWQGEVHGFLVAHCGPYTLNPAVAVAQEQAFYVRPSAEGKGIGSALLHAVEQWASDQGAAVLLLSCFAGYTRVEGMYDARGYRPFERHYIKELL